MAEQPDSLGSRVRYLRQLGGISASDLAHLAALKSRTHVGLIENGTRQTPSGETVVAIARVLGTSAEWLITGEGDGPTEDDVRAAIARTRVEQTPATGTDG
jgi:transcriptional regulator with XRE-family HTH domain